MKKRGFSTIDVVIAVTILITITTSGYLLLKTSATNIRDSQLYAQKLFIAKQEIERCKSSDVTNNYSYNKDSFIVKVELTSQNNTLSSNISELKLTVKQNDSDTNPVILYSHMYNK